jgi:hypothetical protein
MVQRYSRVGYGRMDFTQFELCSLVGPGAHPPVDSSDDGQFGGSVFFATIGRATNRSLQIIADMTVYYRSCSLECHANSRICLLTSAHVDPSVDANDGDRDISGRGAF